MRSNIHVGITYFLIKACKLENGEKQSLGLAFKNYRKLLEIMLMML